MSFRRNKFNAKPVTVDGMRFASTGESKRYLVLKVRQEAGEIEGLTCQVRYRLEVNSVKIADYICDFAYRLGGALTVEDFKSPITAKEPAFRMKRLLMRAIHGIDVKVVLKPDAD